MPLRKEKKNDLKGVWYMYLQIENMYLKTCMKIHTSEKMCKNMYNII